MPTYHYQAIVEWTGAANGPTIDSKTFSRDGMVTLPGPGSIALSAAPEFQGDGGRANPEQLFVASLAGCQMMTYLFLAARNGVRVLSYTDEAEGELAVKEGRLRMTRVTLRPRIVIAPESDLTLAEALVDRAHHDCFIASSVTTEVVLVPEVGALH